MTGTELASYGALIGALATALATFALWRVTRVMARETARLADATAQPQIVASILPNQWSTIHFDIVVENTGNATAFDIEVKFDPPLKNGEVRGNKEGIPFQKISILKPAQSHTSYLGEAKGVLQNTYDVTTSWRVTPDNEVRSDLNYQLDMRDFKHVSYLGSRHALTQLASELKKMREDWRWIASGSKKISVQSYTREDRTEEREILNQRFGRSPSSRHDWWERTHDRRSRYLRSKPKKS